jgi:hypothetical protein
VSRGVKKNQIRTYPTPTYPFEEITLDLAENLNPVNGYSHLLIVLCEFSDFILIFPSKSKRADHVCKILLINVLQPVNVRRLHSDNGPCFRAINWLETVTALNIQVIGSSALHPSGRRHIEHTVGIVKTMLKKMLAIRTTQDWEYLLFLISKIMNNSILPKTSFKPSSMVWVQTTPVSLFRYRKIGATPFYGQE